MYDLHSVLYQHESMLIACVPLTCSQLEPYQPFQILAGINLTDQYRVSHLYCLCLAPMSTRFQPALGTARHPLASG